jgi:digeranylgeranylglycerophospholipid reductase
MHDVIVVGAGPAGLYMATLLAGEGFEVQVVEEHAEIGVPTHCTGVVSDETLGLYKIPEHLLLGRPRRCRVIAPSGASVEFASPTEEIFVVDRAGLDQSLATSAESAGAIVAPGHRAEAISVTPDAVAVATPQRTFHGRVLVLACGVTYRFHRQMGWPMPSTFLHSAQVEVDARPTDMLELHMGRQTAPAGFAWMVPIRRGERSRLKAGLLVAGDARARLRALLARPEIASRLEGPVGEPVRRLLPMGPARRSYGHRVLAVGDAAGLTKPVTGGGIFYSLLSAAFAAEVLAEALRADDLRAGRLAGYEKRWRERLMPEMRAGAWFRRIVSHLTDDELETLIEAAASDDVRTVIDRTARFNWHRSLIGALLRQRGVKSILLRALFR